MSNIPNESDTHELETALSLLVEVTSAWCKQGLVDAIRVRVMRDGDLIKLVAECGQQAHSWSLSPLAGETLVH